MDIKKAAITIMATAVIAGATALALDYLSTASVAAASPASPRDARCSYLVDGNEDTSVASMLPGGSQLRVICYVPEVDEWYGRSATTELEQPSWVVADASGERTVLGPSVDLANSAGDVRLTLDAVVPKFQRSLPLSLDPDYYADVAPQRSIRVLSLERLDDVDLRVETMVVHALLLDVLEEIAELEAVSDRLGGNSGLVIDALVDEVRGKVEAGVPWQAREMIDTSAPLIGELIEVRTTGSRWRLAALALAAAAGALILASGAVSVWVLSRRGPTQLESDAVSAGPDLSQQSLRDLVRVDGGRERPGDLPER